MLNATNATTACSSTLFCCRWVVTGGCCEWMMMDRWQKRNQKKECGSGGASSWTKKTGRRDSVTPHAVCCTHYKSPSLRSSTGALEPPSVHLRDALMGGWNMDSFSTLRMAVSGPNSQMEGPNKCSKAATNKKKIFTVSPRPNSTMGQQLGIDE